MSAGVFAGIGLVMLVLLLRGLFFFAPPERRPGVVVGAVFVLLWILGAWRLNRMGVYVSDHGVRIRNFLATQTIPWASMARLEDQPATSGMGGWAARTLQARAIWVVLKDGRAIQTPLSYRSSQSTAFLLEPSEGRLEGLAAGFTQSQLWLAVQRLAEIAQLIASEPRCRNALDRLRQALRDSR